MLQVFGWSTPGLNVIQELRFYGFNIVRDLVAADHVVDDSEAPGYNVFEGAGGRAGRCFVAANGQRIPNKGEMMLDTQTVDAAISFQFQMALISRPPWSVGQICDAGCKVLFESGQGTLYHIGSGMHVEIFMRKGGLYVGDMKLRNAAYTPTKPRSAMTDGAKQDSLWQG